ncbi:large-conductance mechanosensitive channel protein MscL [Corynebacterium stationis]|uniref:large-conductance mechanosensitive channel protein MscL n=1 Tax=Corynebacterium stationis TaxID=1705 RepID=UPI00321F9DB8
MLKGFKDFIMRGNVIDLAVGVIIGAAFTAIVTAITDSLIQPIINSFGSADMAGLGFQITDNENTFIDFGVVITAVINFLIIAAVVYFVIVAPINKLNEINNKRLGVDEDAPAPTAEELLAEIRDIMAADAGGSTGAHGIDRPTGDDTK